MSYPCNLQASFVWLPAITLSTPVCLCWNSSIVCWCSSIVCADALQLSALFLFSCVCVCVCVDPLQLSVPMLFPWLFCAPGRGRAADLRKRGHPDKHALRGQGTAVCSASLQCAHWVPHLASRPGKPCSWPLLSPFQFWLADVGFLRCVAVVVCATCVLVLQCNGGWVLIVMQSRSSKQTVTVQVCSLSPCA